jgi:hypothetical protein
MRTARSETEFNLLPSQIQFSGSVPLACLNLAARDGPLAGVHAWTRQTTAGKSLYITPPALRLGFRQYLLPRRFTIDDSVADCSLPPALTTPAGSVTKVRRGILIAIIYPLSCDFLQRALMLHFLCIASFPADTHCPLFCILSAYISVLSYTWLPTH